MDPFDWIQTYTGRRFTPLRPKMEAIDIRDIAHALSLLCRFNGHCRAFYSVAEHSLRVSRVLPDELALWGLLHDAAEAYLTDLPRPVKRQIPQYDEMEDHLLRAVARRFRLPWPVPEEVYAVDTRLLATEARDLMGASAKEWGLQAEPMAERIVPWPCEKAEQRFLARFFDLG